MPIRERARAFVRRNFTRSMDLSAEPTRRFVLRLPFAERFFRLPWNTARNDFKDTSVAAVCSVDRVRWRREELVDGIYDGSDRYWGCLDVSIQKLIRCCFEFFFFCFFVTRFFSDFQSWNTLRVSNNDVLEKTVSVGHFIYWYG